MEKILNDIWHWMITEGVKVVLGFVVLYILCKIINVISKKLEKSLSKKKIDKTITITTISVVRKVLKVLLFVCFLTYLGIETSAITGVITSIGLTVGLSLQGSLSNLAGGIILVILRPFKIGDWIECADGTSGTVEKIELFFTQIATGDNKLVMIPNSTLANGKIIDYNTKRTRRWDYIFSIAYEADFKKAKAIIMNCIKESKLYLVDPEPFVNLKTHNSSSIDIVVRVWVKSSDYWKLNWYMVEAVKEAFDRNGISIPYPQMDIHVKNDADYTPVNYDIKNYSFKTNSGQEINIENDGRVEFNDVVASKEQLDKYDEEVAAFDKIVTGAIFKHTSSKKNNEIKKVKKAKKKNKKTAVKEIGVLTTGPIKDEDEKIDKDDSLESTKKEDDKK